MLRLGFVGVGRWSRKLAESFRACGAEVVAHDRRTPSMSEPRYGSTDAYPEAAAAMAATQKEFGRYKPWRDQLADKSIDAIIAVAPPEITTAVAMACATEGKPVCATKPLYDHPATIRAPFYVDFWRLWSDAHREFRDKTDYRGPDGPRLSLCGNGPFRSFPGAFDYGPHVIAAMLDVRFDFEDDWWGVKKPMPCARGELFQLDCELPSGEGCDILFGNGVAESERCIWGHEETPTHIGPQLKSDVMKAFCQSFIADVQEGFVDTKLLGYSREGMRLLRQIREMAK
jgi:hypothetical protein